MLVSTLIDYCCARLMGGRDSRARRRLWLAASMVTNLGLLAYFKYANLLVGSLNWFLTSSGDAPIPWADVILPVGISFYTFQSLSYTVDVYRRQITASRSYAEYLLYVSFFPQLVAGPIERATHLLPQVRSPRRVTAGGVADGVGLILLGYVKKVVIADRLASANLIDGVVDAQAGSA